MKNQKSKLDFTKNSIVELSDSNMNQVNGGGATTTVTPSSWICGAAVSLLTQFEINFNYDAH